MAENRTPLDGDDSTPKKSEQHTFWSTAEETGKRFKTMGEIGVPLVLGSGLLATSIAFLVEFFRRLSPGEGKVVIGPLVATIVLLGFLTWSLIHNARKNAKRDARAELQKLATEAEANRLEREALEDETRPLATFMHARAYVDMLNYRRHVNSNNHGAYYYRHPDSMSAKVSVHFGIEVAHYGNLGKQRVSVQDIRNLSVKVWWPGFNMTGFADRVISEAISVEQRLLPMVGGTPYTHVHTVTAYDIPTPHPEPVLPFCVAEVNATLIMHDDRRTLGISSCVVIPFVTVNAPEVDESARAIRKGLKDHKIEVLDVKLTHGLHDLSWRLNLRPCPSVDIEVDQRKGNRFSDEMIRKVIEAAVARMTRVPLETEEPQPIPGEVPE